MLTVTHPNRAATSVIGSGSSVAAGVANPIVTVDQESKTRPLAQAHSSISRVLLPSFHQRGSDGAPGGSGCW